MNELNEAKFKVPMRQSIQIENRERITLTGITRVDSFDEGEVNARCASSGIAVFGQGLHIAKLDLDNGMLIVDGFISGIEYSDSEKKESFLSRMFK